MSFDTPEENKAFADAQGFPYRLLSADAATGEAYGARRPPSDDPKSAYARRVSYLIDPDGRVVRAYEVTDTAGHPDQVLADLHAAQADG